VKLGSEKLLAYAVAIGALAVVLAQKLAARVPAGELDQLVSYWASWFGLDPMMVRAIVEIESGGDPAAVRPEPALGDASIGLMQTLLQTAQWLWEIGNRALPKPTYDALLDPSTSLYFGCAFLAWLRDRTGGVEELMVRGYNGGLGNSAAGDPDTDDYWRRYQAARARQGG
jgi:soluble lytic murein transglycosylase-like protein